MERQIEELNRSLYTGSAEAVNLHGLARSLAAARRLHAREAVSRRGVVLPAMNP
jgi:hypothetical protein